MDAMDDWYDQQQTLLATNASSETILSPPISYTVLQPTPLSELARQFNVSAEEIWKMNSWYFGIKTYSGSIGDFVIEAKVVLLITGADHS